MRTIEQIINQEDELYLHLFIEYEDSPLCPIYEGKGMPNGIREDSEYLFSLIKKSLQANSSAHIDVGLEKLKMGFIFDSLSIELKISNSEWAEITTPAKFTKNLTLTIHANSSSTFATIRPLIGHELLHAHSYILSGHDNEKYAYDKLFKSTDAEEAFVKSIIYATNDDELNAFIAQITLEIEQQKPRNPDEAMKLLNGNFFYNSYANARKNLPNVSEAKRFCEIYRRLNREHSNMPDRKIILNLRRRFGDIQKRLDRIIPRLCYENRDISKIPIQQEKFWEQFSTLYEKDD